MTKYEMTILTKLDQVTKYSSKMKILKDAAKDIRSEAQRHSLELITKIIGQQQKHYKDERTKDEPKIKTRGKAKLTKGRIFKRTRDMGYVETLEYLNDLYLKAATQEDESMILELIASLKAYGK